MFFFILVSQTGGGGFGTKFQNLPGKNVTAHVQTDLAIEQRVHWVFLPNVPATLLHTQCTGRLLLLSICFLKILCFHWLLFRLCIVLVRRILFHWNIAFLGDITALKGLF